LLPGTSMDPPFFCRQGNTVAWIFFFDRSLSTLVLSPCCGSGVNPYRRRTKTLFCPGLSVSSQFFPLLSCLFGRNGRSYPTSFRFFLLSFGAPVGHASAPKATLLSLFFSQGLPPGFFAPASQCPPFSFCFPAFFLGIARRVFTA